MDRRKAWSIGQRVAAALIGGYALAYFGALFFAGVIAGPRFEGAMTALMASFVFYAAAFLWAFGIRSLQSMWLGLLFAVLLFWLAGLA